MWVRSLGWEAPLEKGMATHSSILAQRIPWTEEPGGHHPQHCKELDVTDATWHTCAHSPGPLQAGSRVACGTTSCGGTQSSGCSSYLRLSPRGILLDAPSPYSLGGQGSGTWSGLCPSDFHMSVHMKTSLASLKMNLSASVVAKVFCFLVSVLAKFLVPSSECHSAKWYLPGVSIAKNLCGCTALWSDL